MNWLILVGVAVLFDVFRIFIDNYISDVYYKGREVAAQKLFSAYAKTIIGIIILIAVGFNFSQFDPLTMFLLFLSGVLSSIAEIPYYVALGIENSTNLGIFIQLAPIFYLILGWLFLGETFSLIQLIAIAIILVAPILIVLTSRKRSRKVKMHAIFLAFLYVLISVIGNLLFTSVNAGRLETDILIEEIAIVVFGVGIMDLIIMYIIFPKWRKRYLHVQKASKNKVLVPLSASLVVGVIKTFAYRMALIAAPAVALASAASDSVEPIVIFFMGIVLTLIWPKFGREKLDKKTVLVHLIATVIVVVGIVLMQM
ncbi:EamA family transporter [Candidatus Saccharibacteria bacterium]|nr:EamA family transporter [Candidatus Saccharibacteria bacterium]MBR3143599.1 EamA family transporter [Candidatus Saccharibacteria bacterium]